MDVPDENPVLAEQPFREERTIIASSKSLDQS
jgi:hypothetical protein